MQESEVFEQIYRDYLKEVVRIDLNKVTADLVIKLDALPRVPILVVFNDRDEDFPAHCSLLFERRAEKYLDMTGWALSEWLKQRVG